MTDEMAIVIMWITIAVTLIIAGVNYNEIFFLHNKRFYSTKYKLEFGWWAMWGFRIGMLLVLFFLFFKTLLLSERWQMDSWIDLLIAGLSIFIMVYLFGLIVGHVALMVYKITDKKYFKEPRETTARQPSKRTRQKTIQQAIESGDLSLSKVVIFALLGSVIVYWALNKIIFW